ncbi:MAG TPA: autotransporter domain-containing protein, partial [Usitatibacter sp.]|nr:autotransporter domain-containing protein [Usitatibacter sp.]
SLSDAGFYRPFLASLGLPPNVVSQLGRFTTNPDPVWSELVSQFYGFTPAPSNTAGGNIFAQGGARVASNSASTPPGLAQRPVSTQINEYLAATGGAADPNALYGIWVGANDIFQNLGALQAGQINAGQLQTNVLAAAGAEVAQIGRLQAAGARYILVFGLPDIGLTPQFAGTPNAGNVTALSAGYNTTLFTGLASAGIRVIPVDTFTLFSEVRANPAAFGFSNITSLACGPFPPITTATSISSQFCLPNTLVQPNANNTFAFADSVHPTGAAQRIIAQLAESLIEGPTQYSLLAEAPLHARESHIRTIADGLLQASQKGLGKFEVFAAGDRGKFDVDSGIGNSGLSSTSRSFTVGATVRTSESVTLGVGIGTGRNNSSFGGDAGGFSTNETALSLFGALRSGGFYGTGIVTLADIKFDNIRRTVHLGQSVRDSDTHTDGSNMSAQFMAGYDFPIGPVTIGPVVSVTTQNVDVNAFDESPAMGVAGLHVAGQKRRSEVWSGGVRASATFGNWTPWARATADKERRDDARFVTATPLSLIAIGNSYDIAAYAPDTSFITTSVGVNGLVTDRVALSVAYMRVSGRSGIQQDGVGATVSVRF